MRCFGARSERPRPTSATITAGANNSRPFAGDAIRANASAETASEAATDGGATSEPSPTSTPGSDQASTIRPGVRQRAITASARTSASGAVVGWSATASPSGRPACAAGSAWSSCSARTSSSTAKATA